MSVHCGYTYFTTAYDLCAQLGLKFLFYGKLKTSSFKQQKEKRKLAFFCMVCILTATGVPGTWYLLSEHTCIRGENEIPFIYLFIYLLIYLSFCWSRNGFQNFALEGHLQSLLLLYFWALYWFVPPSVWAAILHEAQGMSLLSSVTVGLHRDYLFLLVVVGYVFNKAGLNYSPGMWSPYSL